MSSHHATRPLARTIGFGKCWSPNAALWGPGPATHVAARSGRCECRVPRPLPATRVTMPVTTCDAPAITRSMLDLCSAPCKALRFASTALARSLRALTVPARSSRIGNYVMARGVMTRGWPILTLDFGSKRRVVRQPRATVSWLSDAGNPPASASLNSARWPRRCDSAARAARGSASSGPVPYKILETVWRRPPGSKNDR